MVEPTPLKNWTSSPKRGEHERIFETPRYIVAIFWDFLLLFAKNKTDILSMVWPPGWLLTVHKSVSFQGLCMIAWLESFLKKNNICWLKNILHCWLQLIHSSNPRHDVVPQPTNPRGSKHLNSRVACCNAAVLKLIASKIKALNPRKRSEANSNAFTFCNMAWKCPLATERNGIFWRWWAYCQWFCWGILDNNLL